MVDPAAQPDAPLARLGEALHLAVEDPDLTPHRVLDVGLGVAGAGGERGLHGARRDLPEVHHGQIY